jgi:hypothetical protein
MREALENTRRTGMSIPGMSEQYLDQLAATLATWDQPPGGAKRKSRTTNKRPN